MVTTRFSHLGASFAALAIVLGPALAAEAGSAFKFHGRFANRDGTPAAGELHARMAQSSSWMIVHAKGLGGSQTLSAARARTTRPSPASRPIRAGARTCAS